MARQLSSLRSSLSVIQSAIDSSPAIIVTWGADPAFAVQFISRNISQFGYTAGDFLSGRLNYAALIHPEDVIKMRAHVARVKAAGGREYSARYRLRDARGQWRWVESHVVQEVRRGRPIELYHGIVLDITDRMTAEAASKSAEQAFREITETIRDIFFVMAYPSLKPLYVSPGAKTATGFSVAQLLKDPVLWRRTAHPDDLPSVAGALRQCARRGPTTLDFRLVHRDGSVRWTQMRVAPVRDERGRVVRVTGLHHDISDRRRAESESLRREQMEALISRISTVLFPSGAGHLEARIRRALGMAGQFLDIDRCVLRILGPRGDVLTERAAWTRPGITYDDRMTGAIELRRFRWGWARLQKGQPVAIESIDDIPGQMSKARSLVRQMGIRSFLFIPLMDRRCLQVVVSLASIRHTTHWTETTMRLGRALGRLLLKSVQHAEAEAEARRREQREALISRVSALVARRGGPSLARAIDRALAMTGRFLDVDRVLMVRRERKSGVFNEFGCWVRPGIGAPFPVYRNAPVKAIAHIWREISAGRSVVCNSMDELPPSASETRRLGESLGIRSIMFLPALAWNDVQAFLYCSTIGRERRWSQDDERLGGTIGNLIVRALQHSEAESATREREKAEALLARASRDLFSARGAALQARIRRILKEACDRLGADRAIVSHRLPRAPTYNEVGSWTRPELLSRFPVYHDAPVDRIGFIWRQIARRRDTVVARLEDLPPDAADVRTLFTGLGIRSFMLLPVLSWKGVHSGIYFASIHRHVEWSPAAVRMARTLGDLVVKAILHGGAEDDIRSRLASESLALGISRRLVHAAARDVDAAIAWALKNLGRRLRAGRTYVCRVSADRKYATRTHEWCARGVRPQLTESANVPVNAFPWMARCLASGREVVVPVLDEATPKATPERTIPADPGVTSLVFFPITAGGRLLGCLGCEATSAPRAWTEEDLRLGRLVAELFASTLARRESEVALRASETRYRRFTADAPDAIFILARDGRIRDANPAACAQAGAPLAALVGRHAREFLPSLDRRTLDQIRRRLASEGATLLTCPIRRSNGHRLMAEIRVTPLPEGAVLAFVRDVSERYRVERAVLQAATHEQERIGRDLHDMLGQQLTGLSYLSEAVGTSLRRQGIAEARELARMSELLQKCVRHTRFIAHNLAAVELAERGLAGALERLADDTQSLFEIRCEFQNRGTGACAVPIAHELYLIASEAVNNAVRHGRPRQIRISLSTTARRISLEVADDGHWRDPANGTGGIGLRVMRHRTALGGGRLVVEPQSPHGTRVLCVMPLRSDVWSTGGR